MAQENSYCGALLRRHDADRYLTALFAPGERREALFALYAFNLEIARMREAVSEPMMGLIRLQWWRDALAEVAQGKARAHEVVRPLAAAIAAHNLSLPLFERLIAARERDLDPAPPVDLESLVAYARESSGVLTELALEILGMPTAGQRDAGQAAGIAWSLTGLLRAVPFHASQRRVFLPADLLREAGMTAGQLVERGFQPALIPVIKAVADEAGRWAAKTRSAGMVSRPFLPAFLPLSLADLYRRRLVAAGFNPFDAKAQQAPPWRVWRLTLHWLLGRC
ncbi:MAG TPA: phytoene/squalene synthase family protein [Dongiaceae bacterium]|jgi:phytoene synthase